MANSILLYDGDGANRQFVVNFATGYTDVSEIQVTFGDSPTLEPFVLINANLLETTNTAPAGTDNVKIRRVTPSADLRNTFADGPGFTQARVNANFLQLLRLIQESSDLVDLDAIEAALDGVVLPRIDRFTADGTFTPTAGYNLFWVRGKAAGGSGAGSSVCAAGEGSVGAGGGEGAYGEGLFTLAQVGASIAVTVGQSVLGGGPGLAGTNGGFTTFGSLLQLIGGGGGASFGPSSAYRIEAGGFGGAATTADLGFAGERAPLFIHDGDILHQTPDGAGSVLAIGGKPNSSTLAAGPVSGFGAGGSGCVTLGDAGAFSTAKTGGASGGGFLEVWSF